MILLLPLFKRNQISLKLISVGNHFHNALFHLIRILDVDVINSSPVGTGKFEITKVCGYARIDTKSCVIRLYAEDGFGQIPECPGCGSSQLAVLGLAMIIGVASGNHL